MQLVAPDDATRGVDDADAIGVAVERDADLGADLGDLLLEIGDVRLDRGIGVVVGEAAVGLAVQRGHVEAELAQQRHGDAADAVAGVDDDLDPARRRGRCDSSTMAM